MAEFDVSQLATIAVELRVAGRTLPQAARAVVVKGAVNVKRDWRASARETAGRHGRLYPRTIGYDVAATAAVIEATIGPDADLPQGSMGTGFEFGSVHQPPHLDGQRALDAEVPRFLAEMAKLGFA